MNAAPEIVRPDEADGTRLGLLRAAVALLEAGGEQAVKVRDVAGALGVSIGAVYHHFENREELIVAARIFQFEGLLRDDIAALQSVVGSATSVEDLRRGIRALTRAAHGADRAPYRQLRAEIAGNARHHAALAAGLARAQAECTAAFAAIIRQSQVAGFARADLDPQAVGTLVQAVTLGLVLDDLSATAPMDRAAWFALVDSLYDGLLAT